MILTIPCVEADDGVGEESATAIRSAPHFEEKVLLVLLDLLSGGTVDLVQLGLELELVDS